MGVRYGHMAPPDPPNATDAAEPFPIGLSVRKKEGGDAGVSTVRPLVSGSSTKIASVHLGRGERISLLPRFAVAPNTANTYLVLSGTLCCALPGGQLTLGPRDYLVAEDLEVPVELIAVSDASLLYTSSQSPLTSQQQLSELLRRVEALERLQRAS